MVVKVDHKVNVTMDRESEEDENESWDEENVVSYMIKVWAKHLKVDGQLNQPANNNLII